MRSRPLPSIAATPIPTGNRKQACNTSLLAALRRRKRQHTQRAALLRATLTLRLLVAPRAPRTIPTRCHRNRAHHKEAFREVRQARAAPARKNQRPALFRLLLRHQRVTRPRRPWRLLKHTYHHRAQRRQRTQRPLTRGPNYISPIQTVKSSWTLDSC